MSKSIRSQIKQHDFHSIMEISEDVDIQDMGDYVVIDEVFKDPDAVEWFYSRREAFGKYVDTLLLDLSQFCVYCFQPMYLVGRRHG